LWASTSRHPASRTDLFKVVSDPPKAPHSTPDFRWHCFSAAAAAEAGKRSAGRPGLEELFDMPGKLTLPPHPTQQLPAVGGPRESQS